MDFSWASLFLATVLSLCASVLGGDMMRKSIVFDKKTPGLFYCPLSKPTGFEKLYVHSKPLKKLCEFDGKPLPEDYKSDCWNDVDETEYACKEKHRILMRLGSAANGTDFVKPDRTIKKVKAIKKIKRKQG
ncbi:hypothetical protein M8J77_026499 [Diaphorina citri]|nr:hypothetical protein M8J77_026499 [Diaphorina citri]